MQGAADPVSAPGAGRGPGWAERLPADRYHVRTPAGWEGLPGSYNQAFGMVKWYDREKRALWERTAHGYMGLGFD